MKNRSIFKLLFPFFIVGLCTTFIVSNIFYTLTTYQKDSRIQEQLKSYLTSPTFSYSLLNFAYLMNLELKSDPNLTKTENVENIYGYDIPDSLNYQIVSLLNSTKDDFNNEFSFIQYRITNLENNQTLSNISDETLSNHLFYIEFNFDSEGYLTYESNLSNNYQNLYREYIDNIITFLESSTQEKYTMKLLKNIQLQIIIPSDISFDFIMPYLDYFYIVDYTFEILGCILFLTLIGLIINTNKIRQWSIYRNMTEGYLEITSLLSLFIASICALTLDQRGFIDFENISITKNNIYIIFIALYILFFTYLINIIIIKHAFSVNLWKYIKQHSLLYRLLSWIYNSIISVDLNSNHTLQIIKVIIINAITLTVFVALFKYIGIILYSFFLFFILSHYILKIKKDYQNLLNTTTSIASGDFDNFTSIDLGIFSSYRDSISQIKTDFKNAIEKEIESEKMKTDLIANVSHDLKTPLTSIVTYADLLKDETIDETTKKEYISIIDRNALRLKNLINDLFEITKANSGNVSLDYVDIDIVALIKQCLLEYESSFNQLNLTPRFTTSTDSIILSLDSQKTYRILTNLLTNITKYALEHTRVYINIQENQNNVLISIINISKYELNVSANKLTERFVQGDSSRHLEGSGLGLAIAKSFTELQHGNFEVLTEGDLFKTNIIFKK